MTKTFAMGFSGGESNQNNDEPVSGSNSRPSISAIPAPCQLWFRYTNIGGGQASAGASAVDA